MPLQKDFDALNSMAQEELRKSQFKFRSIIETVHGKNSIPTELELKTLRNI